MSISKYSTAMAAVILCGISVGAAHATSVTVLDGSEGWANGDGNSEISSDAPRDGNGSLKVSGDRTRTFGLGNPFDANSNLGLLSDVTSFGFDWRLDSASVSNLASDYTPALRLHIFDGSQRSELIWEGAYNGTYGNTTSDTWYTASLTGTDADVMWRWETGPGITYDTNGAIVTETISDWASGARYSAGAYVAAISVGAGSSVGDDYFAFVDNVSIGFGGADAVTYNFETDAGAVIPVPASLPLLAGALGLSAFVTRRRKKAA
ncbi:PEP-CTERM sorting domain-containing protein [Pseudooceanicola sp.]|uniref:PEP-CTERM sorting domain-containing protein n=1 Tax=Pseudooceanicola sp. TaxID=1914328 RepID=UPI0035C7187A